ncbi:MAG: lantibiotic immunity ABC transporter MutE/EpiE family permease subunit [Butyricicoccus pullicaecorum]|nr:lantibiotic immunity ABC transporter MutE/EpiE family permease subunit [Butyricicoccus pullicaecorum]
MHYLKAEHLKFKRTISNKLLFIAPFLTALFAWIVGGFYGFQYMTFYWWYAFLLSGTIAILCFLAHQKEERAGKYYSVFSAPISLKRFESAKAWILIEKLFVAAVFLAVFATISNLVSPTLAVYSVSRNFIGSIALMIASIWQIPVCLFLARKTGLLIPIAANTLLGMLMPILLGSTALSWICPYCWTAKTAELIMGIESNGTFTGAANFSWSVLLPLAFSVILYILITLWDAADFSRKERGSKWE